MYKSTTIILIVDSAPVFQGTMESLNHDFDYGTADLSSQQLLSVTPLMAYHTVMRAPYRVYLSRTARH
jgi:hypothetical protein